MKLYIISWLWLLLPLLCQAQQKTSEFFGEKPTYPRQLYYDSLFTTPAIYTGVAYEYPRSRIEGNPYFFSEEPVPSTIIYEDFKYENIEAIYDMQIQSVLVEHDNMPNTLKLANEKVSQFTIHNHTFHHLRLDSMAGMQSGFYDLMADGEVQFYVRRRIEYKKEIRDRAVEEWFEPSVKYYLLKDGVFKRVRRKGQVLKVLEDKKKALKAIIRKERIGWNPFPEDSIQKIISRYNQL